MIIQELINENGSLLAYTKRLFKQNVMKLPKLSLLAVEKGNGSDIWEAFWGASDTSEILARWGKDSAKRSVFLVRM